MCSSCNSRPALQLGLPPLLWCMRWGISTNFMKILKIFTDFKMDFLKNCFVEYRWTVDYHSWDTCRPGRPCERSKRRPRPITHWETSKKLISRLPCTRLHAGSEQENSNCPYCSLAQNIKALFSHKHQGFGDYRFVNGTFGPLVPNFYQKNNC